jgi:ubiquinone/menaquinone biosynthesis C-methylase UbiE/DNA-binding transcriptional MerR regulator
MKKQGYYSTGEFMRMAHITKKTIRYYDEQSILKPSYIDPDTRSRFYTDADLARLQQILLLKYLGFSLADIKVMTINQSDSLFMEESLKLQLKLVEERIDQLHNVSDTIKSTAQMLVANREVDWSRSLEVIHRIGLEKSLKNQYNNSSNISARINLHSLYSHNKKGWFPWIFEHCELKTGMRILELGCGDGTFWVENKENIPKAIHVVLSDLSDGMLRDAKRNIEFDSKDFSFQAFNCHEIPFADETYDLVIANHLLFYCDDISKVLREIRRVLKPGGTFISSTYGAAHMKEVSELVSRFDDRIVLSGHKLYEKFGRENGKNILEPYFSKITWYSYEDFLMIPTPESLISYVLSCHGNQNQYIIDRYNEFRLLVQKYTENGFRITKDAGIFISNL